MKTYPSLFLQQITTPLSYNGSGEQVNITLHIIIICAIMVVTGIVGGYVNYILRSDTDYSVRSKNSGEDQSKKSAAKKSWPNIVVGVSATLVVPLFLSTISSTLLSDSRTDLLKYFVFGGFCLLAAIFSKRFLSSMEKQILGKAQEAAEEKAKEVYEEKKGEQKAEFTEFKQAIKSEVAETKQNLDKINEFLQNLKSWESDYNSKGTFAETKFEEQFKPGLKTALDLEPDDKKDSRIFAEAIRFCYNIRKDNVINELIEEYENYQNGKGVKLRIDGTTWTDFALVNLDMYNYSAGELYKKNVLKGCDNALQSIIEYGVALIIKVFMHHIEDVKSGKSDNDQLIKGILDRINNPANNYSAYEAYSYMKKNEQSYLGQTVRELMNDHKTEFDLMLQRSNEYAKANNLAIMNMLFS